MPMKRTILLSIFQLTRSKHIRFSKCMHKLIYTNASNTLIINRNAFFHELLSFTHYFHELPSRTIFTNYLRTTFTNYFHELRTNYLHELFSRTTFFHELLSRRTVFYNTLYSYILDI